MRKLIGLSVLLVVCFAFFALESEARFSTNNRRAVVLEAFYALRPSHDGGCDKTIGGNCVSNWNYLTNDTTAYGSVKGWYGCNSSVWAVPADGTGCGVAPASFYNNPGPYGYSDFGGTSNPVGRAGQCKYFVDLILYRSESQARIDGATHTLPNYATMWANTETNLTTAKEGDVVLAFGWSDVTDHVAIVVEIKKTGSTVTGLDVIDANYISDTGAGNREVIGRHVLPLATFQGKFHIWKGTTYYNEQYIP